MVTKADNLPQEQRRRMNPDERHSARLLYAELIGSLVSEVKAREALMVKFDIPDRTAREVGIEARRMLRKEIEKSLEDSRAELVNRMRQTGRRALRKDAFNAAIKAAEVEAKLLGLNAPEKVDHRVMVQHASALAGPLIQAVLDEVPDPATRKRIADRMGALLEGGAQSDGSGNLVEADVTVKGQA